MNKRRILGIGLAMSLIASISFTGVRYDTPPEYIGKYYEYWSNAVDGYWITAATIVCSSSIEAAGFKIMDAPAPLGMEASLGDSILIVDGTLADSVWLIHDGDDFVVKGDAGTAMFELEGMDIELQNGGTIVDNSATLTTITQDSVKVAGVSWLTGNVFLDVAAGYLTVSDGSYILLTDGEETDSVYFQHDGTDLVLTGDAATTMFELEGLDIELKSGGTITNPSATLTTLTDDTVKVAGIGWITGDVLIAGGDITGANSNAIDISEATDNAITLTRHDAGAITLTSADDDTDADLIVSAGGSGALTLGDVGSTSEISSSDWTISTTGDITNAVLVGSQIRDTATVVWNDSSATLAALYQAVAGDTADVVRGEIRDTATVVWNDSSVTLAALYQGIASDTANVVRGEIRDTATIVWNDSSATLAALYQADISDTGDVLRGEFRDTATIVWNDSSATLAALYQAVAGDTANVVRGEIRDTATVVWNDSSATLAALYQGVAGDTADVVRGEIRDTATVIWNDSSATLAALYQSDISDSCDVVRAEKADSCNLADSAKCWVRGVGTFGTDATADTTAGLTGVTSSSQSWITWTAQPDSATQWWAICKTESLIVSVDTAETGGTFNYLIWK